MILPLRNRPTRGFSPWCQKGPRRGGLAQPRPTVLGPRIHLLLAAKTYTVLKSFSGGNRLSSEARGAGFRPLLPSFRIVLDRDQARWLYWVGARILPCSIPNDLGILPLARSLDQTPASIPRKAETTSGSNCFPDSRKISSRAAAKGNARRYGRSEVMASRVSATAKILAPSGISLPAKPWG